MNKEFNIPVYSGIDRLFHETGEAVCELRIEELDSFSEHPFQVRDDDEMTALVESIRQNGVLNPVLVRQKKDCRYELISGHRRKRACELIGLKTIPAIVRDLDDDEATVLMVDANLQRERILPSEKAFGYKVKLEAIKRQGSRSDLTSTQVEQKLRSVELLAKDAGESRSQVQRYICLTRLIQPLLDLVDDGKIKLVPAVELSFLAVCDQEQLLHGMEELGKRSVSLRQARQLRRAAEEIGGLSCSKACELLQPEEKTADKPKPTVTLDLFDRYFPPDWTPEERIKVIQSLLERWTPRPKDN